MGKEEQEPVSTGQVAAARLRGIRTAQQMSLRELSERVTALGHPMALAMINRIELGLRRMDVDDLTALAAALGVTPPALLMDLDVRDRSDMVTVTGASGAAESMWDWLTGTNAPPGTGDEKEFRWIRYGVPYWIRADANPLTWQELVAMGFEPEERARLLADRLRKDEPDEGGK